jgi:hypothetical protein
VTDLLLAALRPAAQIASSGMQMLPTGDPKRICAARPTASGYLLAPAEPADTAGKTLGEVDVTLLIH